MGIDNRQSAFVSLQHKKASLTVKETTSASRCGSSIAAFSRLASACQNGRLMQGVFYIPKENNRNKTQYSYLGEEMKKETNYGKSIEKSEKVQDEK